MGGCAGGGDKATKTAWVTKGMAVSTAHQGGMICRARSQERNLDTETGESGQHKRSS